MIEFRKLLFTALKEEKSCRRSWQKLKHVRTIDDLWETDTLSRDDIDWFTWLIAENLNLNTRHEAFQKEWDDAWEKERFNYRELYSPSFHDAIDSIVASIFKTLYTKQNVIDTLKVSYRKYWQRKLEEAL